MSNPILGKFSLENLYYSTLPEGIDRVPSKNPGLLETRIQPRIRRNFYAINRLVEEGKSPVLNCSEALIKIGESGDDPDRQMRINVGQVAEDAAMVKKLIQLRETRNTCISMRMNE